MGGDLSQKQDLAAARAGGADSDCKKKMTTESERGGTKRDKGRDAKVSEKKWGKTLKPDRRLQNAKPESLLGGKAIPRGAQGRGNRKHATNTNVRPPSKC